MLSGLYTFVESYKYVIKTRFLHSENGNIFYLRFSDNAPAT